MKNRTKALPHPRAAALQGIVDMLNIWAMAPEDASRRDGLKAALNRYARDVRGGQYPAISGEVCAPTAAVASHPQASLSEFERHFGSSEEKPAGGPTAAPSLPWED